MVGADGELKSVSGVLSLDVFEVECHAGVVDDHMQLLSRRVKLIDELAYRLQRRQIQLHRHTSTRYRFVLILTETGRHLQPPDKFPGL